MNSSLMILILSIGLFSCSQMVKASRTPASFDSRQCIDKLSISTAEFIKGNYPAFEIISIKQLPSGSQVGEVNFITISVNGVINQQSIIASYDLGYVHKNEECEVVKSRQLSYSFEHVSGNTPMSIEKCLVKTVESMKEFFPNVVKLEQLKDNKENPHWVFKSLNIKAYVSKKYCTISNIEKP